MRIKIVVLSRGRSAPALRPFFFCCTCVYSASVSPHSQSIDTERALARVRSSASQTCLWFFSIREIIKGVISIPNSCILRARSSCVIGGFCNARPSRTRSAHILPRIRNKFFPTLYTHLHLSTTDVFIQFIDFTMKPDIMLTRIDVKYPL